ncbi:acyltransferase [Myxococcota bacterium]
MSAPNQVTAESVALLSKLMHRLRPVAKQIMHCALAPTGPLRPMYSGLYHAQWVIRELCEMAHRSLIATPMFLTQCAVHGKRISVERIPYIQGQCHIELGNDVRISGQIDIAADRERRPVLKIGSCVFIGHATTFGIGERIEIGDYVSIGNNCHITDTEGHNKYPDQCKPSWELRARAEDISPVVIEDGAWLGQGVCVLKGVRIGARSIIGMNAVVRTNVPADAVVMGNPAKTIPMNLFRRTAPPPGSIKPGASSSGE